MRALTHLGIPAGVIAVLTASTVTLGTGAASATGPIPLNASLRNCDFSLVSTAIQVPHTALGRGTALVQSSGSTVTAQVHMVVSNEPGTHFDVGLIQTPRPSSATCGPGDPGTTFTGLDTDGSGQATVTLQAPLREGTTGVWVIVETGNAHNQAPGEFYTSEFQAPV
ncbi:hypothetical protein A5634_16805 [Mycobacterium asiaticum]|uniref:Uncharacterized protein n=2 Tax=Mycobacterium asiaticum TaxID=1790 RepID=A0A1A3PC38_MYCAS|nr:hypothetical protein A5634_16805 [Mycobacterium asiaticum]